MTYDELNEIEAIAAHRYNMMHKGHHCANCLYRYECPDSHDGRPCGGWQKDE